MNVLVACKIVLDDQDIRVVGDELDFSKAKPTISTYDLNAIEAACVLRGDGMVKAIGVGPKLIDDSKTMKNILARGADELLLTADDACSNLDAHATAAELKKLAEKAGLYDVILVGDGSADLYARQTGVQLAAVLDVPYVSGVIAAESVGEKITARRLLASEVETVEVPTPCVLSIAPDFAEPRIPGMKDILAAGKKPMDVAAADSASESATEQVAVKAPEHVDRKCQVFEADDVEAFAAAIKAAV